MDLNIRHNRLADSGGITSSHVRPDALVIFDPSLRMMDLVSESLTEMLSVDVAASLSELPDLTMAESTLFLLRFRGRAFQAVGEGALWEGAVAGDMDNCRETVARMKEKPGTARVFIVADHVDDAMELGGLELGADGVMGEDMVPAFLRRLLSPEKQASAHSRLSGNTRPEGHFFMKVGEGNLASIIQFLGSNGQTGELRITFERDGQVGHIFTEKNRIQHAVIGAQRGQDAIAAMFLGGAAEAHFFDGHSTRELTVGLPVDQVLLNTMVLADELKARS